MDKILNHILSKDEEIIKYGQVDEKIMRELKMTTSLYDYIQVITNYYDNDERPYSNNWTDVEGMGYGWRWMRFEEENWHKMMGRMVSEEADYLLTVSEHTLYFVYESNTVKTYHFVSLDGFRQDTIFSFSNEELHY